MRSVVEGARPASSPLGPLSPLRGQLPRKRGSMGTDLS